MEDNEGKDQPGRALEVDDIIQERERLDKLFKEQFTRDITVMFTDLKGSTSIAETHGDFATRSLIKQHNDIVFPLVKKHNGTLVKSMGDGTMSYFPGPQDAVRAAAEIQKGMEAFNLEKKAAIPIFMRIGIHKGQGIVEKNDIYGDVVNVASRIEGQANPGEIYMSEEAYNGLSDKSEVYCGFAKQTTLKGKKEAVKLYKAFWNPTEMERDLSAKKPAHAPEEGKGLPLPVKVVAGLVLVLVAALVLIKMTGPSSSDEEKRTVEHNVTVQGAEN
mgnify:FL=1